MAVTATEKVSVHERAESAVKKAESDVAEGYVRVWYTKGSVAMPKPYQDVLADSKLLFHYVRKSTDTNNITIDRLEGGAGTKELLAKAKSDAREYTEYLANEQRTKSIKAFKPGHKAE